MAHMDWLNALAAAWGRRQEHGDTHTMTMIEFGTYLRGLGLSRPAISKNTPLWTVLDGDKSKRFRITGSGSNMRVTFRRIVQAAVPTPAAPAPSVAAAHTHQVVAVPVVREPTVAGRTGALAVNGGNVATLFANMRLGASGGVASSDGSLRAAAIGSVSDGSTDNGGTDSAAHGSRLASSSPTALVAHFYAPEPHIDAALSLPDGVSLVDSAHACGLIEGGLLGALTTPDGAHVGTSVFLNTHEPFCLITVGVQGSGKSHTLGVVLESVLVPAAADNNDDDGADGEAVDGLGLGGVVKLRAPMATLVLHYDTAANACCEATGLVEPSAYVARALAADTMRRASAGAFNGDNGGVAQSRAAAAAASALPASPHGPPSPAPASGGAFPPAPAQGAVPPPPPAPAAAPVLPLTSLVVLVSPTFYLQRRAYFAARIPDARVVVRPLLFSWADLTASQLKTLMRVGGDGGASAAAQPLYVSAMLDQLRRYQRAGRKPAFDEFLREFARGLEAGQAGPLRQRVAILSSLVADAAENADLRAVGGDVRACARPGTLVVADLTDPMLSGDDAAAVFTVLVEQFREAPLRRAGTLLALDEAHRYVAGGGPGAAALAATVVDAARMMRHYGMRVAVSTQSPATLPHELLELATVIVAHRFHSAEWFRALSARAPFPPAAFAAIRALDTGAAIVWAARHAVRMPANDGSGGSGGGGGNDDASAMTADIDALAPLLRVAVRPRLTSDSGSTRRNH